MAWLEKKNNGIYQISFRFAGQRYKKSLKTKVESKAESRKTRIEETIQLVEQGRLDLPDDVDIPTFLLSDGKLNNKPIITKPHTIADVFNQYLENIPEGALEENSLYTAKIHMKHHKSILGSKFSFKNIDVDALQNYINKRSQQKGRRERIVSTTTIKKEIGTLSSVWTWAKNRKLVNTDFPSSNLKFPKLYDKPPFQTWKQIEQQISRENLNQTKVEELWDCLYLTLEEIDKVLDFVKENARHDFIYPMVVTAAHTGARRSELIRSQPEDIDLYNGLFRIREKKKAKDRVTIRTVPISPALNTVLEKWLKNHSSSSFTFYNMCKKCKGSEHDAELTGLKVGEATHHLQQTLKDSKWSKIRGWHVFRHSFISNCASKGVDQRMIDEWVGHTTEAMRRRYRHLFPDSQAAALESVFGKREQSLVLDAS
ncbi:tyrosine-type recombinase/integrase [Gimesia panareensis]|uniref:tyrosine-type recombinase/integrase n=1 Tax=Gimesia panareensis TaxID=2527978 RepID=UPI00118B4FB7|nr:site-specific integrase [Gimesia panareensis]QDU52110.1 site-specific tyrosine recombinase XerD [Gimesia panareensis]